MKSLWRILILCSVIISIVGFFAWQMFFPTNDPSLTTMNFEKPTPELTSNVTSTKK